MKKSAVLVLMLCLLMSVCAVGMADAEHSHPLCVVDGCEEYHDDHLPLDFAPLPADSNFNRAFYYLTEDTTLDPFTLDEDSHLYICLNGYTLYHNGITIDNGDSWYDSFLYVCDCQGTGKITPAEDTTDKIEIVSGNFILYGGTITGHTDTAIILTGQSDDSFFSMLGGELSGNSGVNGGAVAILSTYDGVYLSGVIRNNSADRGGALYSDGGQFSIGDALITGNTAREGGAIYHSAKRGGYDHYFQDGTVITGNSTTGGMGGAAYFDKHSQGISFYDHVVITGNTSNGEVCNVYYPADLGDLPYAYHTTGTIGIWLESDQPVTPDHPVVFVQGNGEGGEIFDAGILKAFVSDQGYAVRRNDDLYGEFYIPSDSPVPAPPVPAPPATGDSAPVALWAAMLLMTAGAAMLLRRRTAK